MEETTPYTEQELVSLLSKDSELAFQILFDRYSQKLYRFSLSYLKHDSDSEEIVQEVFLKIWENRNGLKNNKSFQSYLFTIAFNAIKKRFNRKMREEKYKYDLFDSLNQENTALEKQLNFEALVNKLEFLIDQMPEKRKAIFLLRKREGKSIDEIAGVMGISSKTVKNQITEAMHYLKKSFAGDDASSLLFYFLFLL